MMGALSDLVVALESSGTPYMIGGSLASILYGQPRTTMDCDIVVDVDRNGALTLASALDPQFFVSGIEDAFLQREEYRCFQALHWAENFKVDIFICDEDDYSRMAFSRRTRSTFGPHIEACFTSPEDIVLRKILWHNLGRRVSDRQWNDLVQVIEVMGETLDWDYMRRWADWLDISDRLSEARKDAKL